MKRFLLILTLLLWTTPAWSVNVIGSGTVAETSGAFVNLTSFAGSNGDSITVDTGWVLHTSYSGTVKIQSSRAYQDTTTNALFYRSETPTSADQTITAGIYNADNVSGRAINLAARINTAANTFFIGQIYSGSAYTECKLFKFEGGTATQIGSTTTATKPAVGSTVDLVFSVSGTSPNIVLTLDYNGNNIFNQTGVSATGLDGAGKVGIRFGTSVTASTTTTGLHVSSFSAE